MMRLKFAFCLSLISMWSSIVLAGNAYFVDLDASSNGDGSFQKPWNNISTVNRYNFTQGDDLYFKCGTTSSGTESLDVNWSGNANDRAIIGAYYIKGNTPLYGVNDDGPPNIKGVLGSYPQKDDALVFISNQDYVTVRDINLSNSGAIGLAAKSCSGLLIANLYVKYTNQNGIIFNTLKGVGVTNSTIEDCVIERSSYNTSPGAAIVISADFNNGSTKNITVRRNRVFNAYEGIGLYKTPSYVTVEQNVVYDCRSYHMYVDRGSHHIVWRNNIVYESSSSISANGAYMFAMNNESHNKLPDNSYGYIEYYGNLIAGGKIGFSLGNSGSDQGLIPTNIKIYDNIIVDCLKNFMIWSSFNGKNIEIKNNVSAIYSSGGLHVLEQSNPADIIWTKNIFNTSPKGDAANNSIISDVLVKTTGWRSLQPNKLTEGDFSLKDNSYSASNTISGTQLLVPPKPTNLRIQ